ncbi:MAG: hypothetical protein U1D06_04910 [Paracoccaceae bacterium]|nr:hypothetical protein [Paracoccaceae bacterium]
MRLSAIAIALFPTLAAADAGLHHHPHGIEYGWMIAAALGLLGGLALAYGWGRRK